ncbi:MAG: NAAT family transporter [Alphaproteobacteria bacterium]|nr:NAAT family transporter [Alphaproteobacteria bacterium]
MIFGVVAGPIKALAFFNATTQHFERKERIKIAVKSVIVSSIVLFVFAFRGNNIIDLFHVSVPALEIAGGTILFVFALSLVLGESHDHNEEVKGDGIAFYPMAMPMMASPQAIVAIVIVGARADELADKVIMLSALGIQMALNLLILVGVVFLGKPESDVKKKSGGSSEVVLRIVALLLCGFAVELVLLGLRDLEIIPQLAAHAAH